ncbi:MAG: hypothetical protein GEU90_18350 [Gemmatimonas sp.]|nr:hypothetical protein [Gemmatimonas sp.]
MGSDPDVLDLREIGAVLREGWRWVVGGLLVGLLGAALVLILVRPRYEATALVLLRNTPVPSAGVLDMVGGSQTLGGLSSLLGADAGFETEVAILSSRSIAGAVVESLGLQADVIEPGGWTPRRLFATAHYPEDLEEGVYEFERSGDGYLVRGPRTRSEVRAGETVVIGGAVVTLAGSGLPSSFSIELRDFSDAVTGVNESLDVEQAGGTVAELEYRTTSPQLAAEIPNALVAEYMARRRTTGRGINQQRYAFLSEHVDSLSLELERATVALREHQEASGVVDPEASTEAEVEQLMLLRADGEELAIEARALREKLEPRPGIELNAREVAAYPALFANPAINQLLARLTTIDSELAELLERRTEEDPDVRRLVGESQAIEDQIIGMARSYHQSIEQQLQEVSVELDGSHAAIAALPAQVERSFRLERDVDRLAMTLAALETQLVQVRLAAIAELGDVRQIDQAEVPKRVAFPQPMLTLAIGLLAGLFVGTAGALTGGSLGRRVKSVGQVERMTGLPAVSFDPPAPLLIGELGERKSVLVVPVGAGARAGPVAMRIAETAALRGERVVLADWTRDVRILPSGSDSSPDRHGAGSTVDDRRDADDRPEGADYTLHRRAGPDLPATIARSEIEGLEESGSFVVSLLPNIKQPVSVALLSKERTAVLVAPAGARRTELVAAAGILKQLGVPLAGVVVHNGFDDGAGATA